MSEGLPACLRIESALKQFVEATGTQSQEHIKPLHKYISLGLAIEGGFFPSEITPHPPLRYEGRRSPYKLIFDSSQETASERTIIGGIKSKNVDVVVSREGIGPVVCVSVKGTGNAFRNLPNRMEEAIGDCANIHMMYPGLVYGFLHLLKANHANQPDILPNDISLGADGEVTASIRRWHDILVDLSGRGLIHTDLMRYETIGLLLVEASGAKSGNIFAAFPPPKSPLLIDSFFPTLYNFYDVRFPYKIAQGNFAKRAEWDESSPAFADIREQVGQDLNAALGYSPRLR